MIDLVLLASGADELRIVHAFATELPDRVRVVRRCAELTEALAAVSAGVADAVLVDCDVDGLDRSSVAQLMAGGTAVIGLDGGTRRAPADLGITWGIDPAADVEQMYSTILEAVAGADDADAWTTDEPVDEPRGRIITVWGPAGAPGRSTIAANIAGELARAGRRTILVDADTDAPCQSQLLGVVDEVPGLVTAARLATSSQLTADALHRIVPEIEPNLRLLSGIGVPSRWAEVEPSALTAVLAALAREADAVVVDIAAGLEDDDALADSLISCRDGAAISALAEADEVIGVCAADPVSITRFVREVGPLQAITSAPVHVIINGTDRAAPESQLQAAIAQRFTPAGITTVPRDPLVMRRALWDGALLAEAAPRSAVRRALQRAAEAAVERIDQHWRQAAAVPA
ncbi:AAA family ATPase [Helcobacillus massiliensis]|uniref:MinD-like ATPase involved in chromosome partitioning or flagellar assembly n=1 Tax=Helcobacillus massiliensis TaxID=521392 RepID=A0A839QNW5_9MICO|nr:pilus assembly protein CpaE [Helcobacillus massiliensis]MBB3021994.1 MinD-like ATPase involved in chromosome partitioning or flagellar assembly [Helcobacillus massiliensis]